MAALLKAMGACRESQEWARRYGTDWRRAWEGCGEAEWACWLLGRLGLQAADLSFCCPCRDCTPDYLARARAAVPYAAVARAARRAWAERGGAK